MLSLPIFYIKEKTMKQVWISVFGIVLVTAALIYALPVGLFGAGVLITIGVVRIVKTIWG